MTPINVIAENIRQDLHTLVYLDIQDDRFMTIHKAVTLLEEMAARSGGHIPLYVGIARAGSDSPVVRAGDARTLLATDFGSPLHIIAIYVPEIRLTSNICFVNSPSFSFSTGLPRISYILKSPCGNFPSIFSTTIILFEV